MVHSRSCCSTPIWSKTVRTITRQLYGGDKVYRLKQEIILGTDVDQLRNLAKSVTVE